jgi:hypothetical protein
MSPNLAPPPPGPAKSKTRRPFAPWLSEKPETRSVQIGVLATILVHLLFLLFAPRMFLGARTHSAPRQHAMRQFNIELAPDQLRAPKPRVKPKMKYVEANPNAPENTPDKTNNVSDRNQQAAQEKPTPNHKSEMPTTEGRKDIQAQQIVTGSLAKPETTTPPAPPSPPKPAANLVQRREQNPYSGFEKNQGTDENGFATNIGKKAPNEQPIPERIAGSKDGPLIAPFSFGAPQIDPKHPMPRRQLEIHVRPAVFAENKFGTSNVGVQALDSRFNNYGVYLKRLSEAVQAEWDRILDNSSIITASGNTVVVVFKLNSKGEVSQIVSVEPTPGTSDASTRACPSAIAIPAPYGPWTEDMIAVLGTEQELVFTFYYE